MPRITLRANRDKIKEIVKFKLNSVEYNFGLHTGARTDANEMITLHVTVMLLLMLM